VSACSKLEHLDDGAVISKQKLSVDGSLSVQDLKGKGFFYGAPFSSEKIFCDGSLFIPKTDIS